MLCQWCQDNGSLPGCLPRACFFHLETPWPGCRQPGYLQPGDATPWSAQITGTSRASTRQPPNLWLQPLHLLHSPAATHEPLLCQGAGRHLLLLIKTSCSTCFVSFIRGKNMALVVKVIQHRQGSMGLGAFLGSKPRSCN